MFWWAVIIGLVAFLVLVTVMENHRGTRAPFKGQDRHLNAPDRRGASGGEQGWGNSV